MGHLALRDVCCLARVSRDWKVAVDGAASFWKRLVYWEPLTLLVALEAAEERRFGTDLGQWLGLLQRVRAMSLRQQVQKMLNVPASCQACGVALQGRHLSKAVKTGAVTREIPAISNLTRLCGDCGNDFVVPQQSARSLFPEIGRADYLLLRSLKLDNRKCLILSDLRHRASRKRGELLEHEARTLGISARQLWERRNVPRPKGAEHLSGTDAVKAFFDEIDDEDDDPAAKRNGETVKSTEPKKVSWVPLHLVFEQPGEEWAPDSHETVARRNLELLQELRLVEMVKREDTQVGFVETWDTPYSEATPAPAKKQRKRKDDDDEDDYEEEHSASPEKRGRGRGKASSQEFRLGDDDDDDDDDDDIDSDEEDEDSFIKPTKKKGAAAANSANANNKKKAGRKKKKGAYDDDEDEMGDEGDDDDDDDGASYGRKGRKKKAPVAAAGSRKGGRRGSARNGKAEVPSRDRPNVIKTFAELQSNPELKTFIAKFGWSKVPHSHPEYRVCLARYDTTEKTDDGFLKFRMRDELMVGFWNDKSGWSVCYVLNDARNDRGGFKWGLVANNYVEMIDWWTPQEMADAISHRKE